MNSRQKRHSRIINRVILCFQAAITLYCLLIVYWRSKYDQDSDDMDDSVNHGGYYWLRCVREAYGLALFILAFSIWFWSRWKLGEQNSFSLLPSPPPKLVIDGPFAFTSHPVYVSSFIYMLSFMLMTRSLRGLILLIALGLPVQVYRAHKEGNVLKKTFGFKYTRYVEDVISANYRKKRMWWYILWLSLVFSLPSIAFADTPPESKKWLRNAAIASDTYERLIPCLSFDRNYNFNYPIDAAQHYEHILNLTSKFRGLPPHTGQGYYREKWIENHFIDTFLNKPLESFSGLFPLFVQWSDIDVQQHNDDPSLSPRARLKVFSELLAALRPTVMYVTVSQANRGLDCVKIDHPNVLVLNAGGDGNVPIPLIKGKIALHNTPSFLSFASDIGFIGNMQHEYTRQKAMNYIEMAVDEYNQNFLDRDSERLSFDVWPAVENNNTYWQSKMASTMVNLAPRGYGRASFRLAEIVQMGRIPAYIYNDVPWIPYAGTPAGCDSLGFVVRDTWDELKHFVWSVGDMVKGMGSSKSQKGQLSSIASRLKRVRQYRYEYTYRGVMRQIALFFKDPLDRSGQGLDGGGFLRCAHVPHDYLAAPLDNLLH